MEIKKIGYCFKVAIHSFKSTFQLILLDPPKLIIALSNLVNNPISPIKSLNQMSNNKITLFKLPRTDYPLPVLGIFSPTPSFRPVNFRKICLKSGPPCIFCAKGSPIDLMQILRESTQDHNEQCTNMCHPSTFFAICEQR